MNEEKISDAILASFMQLHRGVFDAEQQKAIHDAILLAIKAYHESIS